jgi:hypothetical protein
MKRVLILAAIVGVAALLWWQLGERPAAEEGAARPQAERTAENGRTATTPELDVGIEGEATGEASVREEAESARLASRPASNSNRDAAFVGQLVNAERGGKVDPPRDGVEVLFSKAERRERAEFDSESASFRIAGLAGGEWQLEIRAKGFHELRTSVRIDAKKPSEDTFKLWPATWIVVRAKTLDGAPYGEIARRLGLEPADLFEEGFRVWRSSTPPENDATWPATPPLEPDGDFSRASPHYERQRMDARDVARVRREAGATTWLALAFHSRFCGWAEVPGNVNAVEFELAAEDVTEQFGSLEFCAVDAHSEAPLADARAWLNAEVSGLRRPDTDKLAADELGCFSAKPLLPGEYDFAVTAPGRAEHHQRIQIAPGERVDLGEIALELAQQLEIHVVDENGAPAQVLVQLGAWRAGAWIEHCITPHASTTDGDGLVRVSMPSVKTVVSAQPIQRLPDGRAQPDPRRGAAVTTFDPSSRATRLEIALPKLHAVGLVLPNAVESAVWLRVLDEFEIAVARQRVAAEAFRFQLAAGQWRAQLVDAFDAELARYSFRVPPGGPEGPIVLE